MRGAWIVLLLLAPLASAQLGHAPYASAREDPAAVFAPVAVLFAAGPDLVALATTEAARDGTPDAAEALAARMVAHAEGLHDGTAWPEAATSRHLDDLTFEPAVRWAHLAATVPADVGVVARETAACDAYGAAAGPTKLNARARLAWPAFGRLSAAAPLLAAVAAAYPAEAGVGEAVEASRALEAWLARSVPRARACLPDADFLELRVVPAVAWPTATVTVHGATGPSGVVELAAPTLGYAATVRADDLGGFAAALEVPLDAPLGAHTVTATSGAATASATLTVARAPARLVLAHPREVAPGEEFRVGVRVVTPLPSHVGAGPVAFAGDLRAEVALADAAGSATFRAPDAEGVLAADVAYPGSALVAPATARLLVRVVEEPAPVRERASDVQALPIFPPPPPPGARPLPEARDVGWLAAAVALLALLAALALLVVRALRRRPRRVAPAAPAPGAPAPLAARAEALAASWPTVTAAFGALVVWLVRTGLARPSWTAREVAADLRRRGVRADAVVLAFERERYGGVRQPTEPSRLSAWFRALRERLGGSRA